jgi:hypothetical protein
MKKGLANLNSISDNVVSVSSTFLTRSDSADDNHVSNCISNFLIVVFMDIMIAQFFAKLDVKSHGTITCECQYRGNRHRHTLDFFQLLATSQTKLNLFV